MFHVLDHSEIVFSGNLSQATQCVIERSGMRLDDAVRSGLRILYSDTLHSLREANRLACPGCWDPIDEWLLD